MKGLLVSLIALVLTVVISTFAAHLSRPKSHILLFAAWSFIGAPVYVIAFLATPPDLYFLPGAWMVHNSRLDLVYGLVVYFLNCHSFIDFFSASCGGFSTALMVAILKNGNRPTTTEDLVGRFKSPPEPAITSTTGEATDLIYARRLAMLVQKQYLTVDTATRRYSLTSKGRAVASLAHTLKRLMNLGEGG